MIILKKAVMKIISSFMDMGKISKTILKGTFVIFSFLAVPAIMGMSVLAKTTPNPDLFFLCKSALETGGQVISIGFIGAIMMNAVFKK